MALAFDEFGRPFIILREQEKKTRLRGLDAQTGLTKPTGPVKPPPSGSGLPDRFDRTGLTGNR